uniref:Uncharacterized protein n=1 Tax=Amphimedon queenslandica TaxID=400682 RepID=A0A1X7V604_AMPQE
MAAHLRNSDQWLNEPPNHNHKRCEVWDGNHFAELKWFWNPSKRCLLPTRCPFYRPWQLFSLGLLLKQAHMKL